MSFGNSRTRRCLTALTTFAIFAAAVHASQRPFAVDDLFELEDVGRYYGGPYAFSPDGQKLAFTRVRAKKALTNYKWEYLWGNAGADIWVQPSATVQPLNVTHGEVDGSGWWAPQWSPDGRRLAMLSTRGGNVHLWGWDSTTGKIEQLSVQAVDLVDLDPRPILWVDAKHLVFPALPSEERPRHMMIELQTPTIAAREWPKTANGLEPASSVLQSGTESGGKRKPRGNLVLLDVESGMETVLAQGMTRAWRLSPDGKTLAVSRQISPYIPKAGEPLPYEFYGRSALDVISVSGPTLGMDRETGADILAGSVRWSPTRKELAFLGSTGGPNNPPRLYTVNPAQNHVTERSLYGLDVSPAVREEPQIEWISDGDIVLRGAKRPNDARPASAERRDWWVVGSRGLPKCLTASMKTPPRELWRQSGNRYLIGISEGDVWRLDPARGSVENLTIRFDPKIERILWPSRESRAEYALRGRDYSQLVVAARQGNSVLPYLLDLGSGEMTPIQKPAPEANLVAYAPLSGSTVFFANDRSGLRIWRGKIRDSGSTLLTEANQFLRDVDEAQFKSIEYVSLNGQTLHGALLLPVGYEPGKRYPLLTWVYPGSVYSASPPASMSIASTNSLNPEIPAAHGYAVLMPSMPLPPEGLADDPMLRLADGVLPAVSKVIELGIADPAEVFLFGHSFGGFATYGLITQTQRFKAAVALAGATDLVSLYGEFDARERYTDNPLAYLFQVAGLESSQLRMGAPPWKDLDRYMRNSPISFVDRVRTPLMIIQGDMDYVPLQQGEEFYTALYRQGKRAEFVRYWGEGHVLQSPANIRDMWNRIFAWLDEFKGKSGELMQ